MADYLVFRLYAPLVSWGEIAVGESRHSAPQPSRSALLGLLGAALGIRRDDEAGQQALAAGYHFGVKLLAPGLPLRDYHTVQAPPTLKKRRYSTRRQELALPNDQLGTLLSSRDYRCDSLSVVAAVAAAGAPHPLPAIQAALHRPAFTLYLGRKSCPPALPLNPQLREFANLREALDSCDGDPLGLTGVQEAGWRLGYGSQPGRQRSRYFCDDALAADSGLPLQLATTRHDQPLSRRRWQFAPRREHVGWVDAASEAAGEEGEGLHE